MSSQARTRPSWKKNSRKNNKRKLELYYRAFNKDIFERCQMQGFGITSAGLFVKSLEPINIDELEKEEPGIGRWL